MRPHADYAAAAMSTPDAPAYLDLVPFAEGEDAPPTAANFVNVSGDGDAFALDFYYVHPAKVARIFEGASPGPGSVREGDTLSYPAAPVARLTIPLTTATELAIELIERIGEGVPNVQAVLRDFGARLHELSHDGHDHDEDDDHEHDHDHDHGHGDERHDHDHGKR